MAYLWLKLLHILSATVLFGTGLGTAFYLFVTHRSGHVGAIAVVSRWVVRADWWFTTPAVIIQPLSGLALVHLAGIPWNTLWLQLTLALYLFVGACWLPVIWLQLRLRDMATAADAGGRPLPDQYWRYARYWEALGYPAFIAVLGIFYLMVVKPI